MGISMDTETFVQEMFKADSSIRYIAIVDDQYRILASKYNEGVIPLTSDEMDRNFVSIMLRIIVESVGKLSPFLGEVGGITAHYQKTPFYDRITKAFQKLSTQYLT